MIILTVECTVDVQGKLRCTTHTNRMPLSTVICHNHTHGLIVLKQTNKQTQEDGEEEEEKAAAKNR